MDHNDPGVLILPQKPLKVRQCLGGGRSVARQDFGCGGTNEGIGVAEDGGQGLERVSGVGFNQPERGHRKPADFNILMAQRLEESWDHLPASGDLPDRLSGVEARQGVGVGLKHPFEVGHRHFQIQAVVHRRAQLPEGMGGGSADHRIVVGKGIDEHGDCLVAKIGDFAQGAAIQNGVLKGVCQKAKQGDEVFACVGHVMGM
jgi:hypothetical protein